MFFLPRPSNFAIFDGKVLAKTSDMRLQPLCSTPSSSERYALRQRAAIRRPMNATHKGCVLPIWLFSTAKLQTPEDQSDEIWQSAIAKLEEWSTPADRLFYRLNYTCLAYLTSIDDPLKRAFYEQETIRGCWTQKELDRQVSSQYYERMGLSKDKKALQKLAVKNAQQLAPRDILHNPVTLEFLGLESQDVYTETKLESYTTEPPL